MNCFWIFWFLFFFKTEICNSSFIFTQYDKGISVCENDFGGYCKQGVLPIFEGINNNHVMTLGFLNAPSEKFYDDYDMAEFGFPIFYEYFPETTTFKVNLIIANGKLDKEEYGRGLYYYVSLEDNENKCGNIHPKNPSETLSGALYLNQKYAKYAYYIYQSSSAKTCILSIKFEDLFQGNYGTKNLVTIKPQEVHLIKNELKNFYYPFFTIDPIFGTMVYLTRNGSELAAVHYKINENNLTNFEKVFTFLLKLNENLPAAERISMIFKFPGSMYDNEWDLYPSFTSYGKTTFLFFAKTIPEDPGVTGFWSPKKKVEENTRLLELSDRQRHLYYLDPEYFEKGEPVGKFISTTKSSSSASENVPDSECPDPTSSYLGLFIAFAVIDFLLMLGLLGIGITICLGSKKMKKLRHLKNPFHRRSGKQQSTMYGVTTGATTVAGGGATTVAGNTTIAPTNLNTQFSTKPTAAGATTKATTVNGKNGATGAASGAPSAPVGTTVRKTTQFQTWES